MRITAETPRISKLTSAYSCKHTFSFMKVDFGLLLRFDRDSILDNERNCLNFVANSNYICQSVKAFPNESSIEDCLEDTCKLHDPQKMVYKDSVLVSLKLSSFSTTHFPHI